MVKCTLLVGLVALSCAWAVHAQTKKTGVVPCFDGDPYPNCTPARALSNRRALANATSAAVIVDARQGIACGDGSDGCIRTDSGAVATIQKEVAESTLWHELTNVEAKKADILLKFQTKDRSSLQLCVYDADTNDLLWCDYRNPSVALDNDSSREIAHFIGALKASQKMVIK
jgi:hypothetical protein